MFMKTEASGKGISFIWKKQNWLALVILEGWRDSESRSYQGKRETRAIRGPQHKRQSDSPDRNAGVNSAAL